MQKKAKVLVIQGAGMELRGKVQLDVFGPETLEEINARIETEAAVLGLEVEIVQSNDEDAVVALLESRAAGEYLALLINPGGFTTTEGPLPEAIAQLTFPAYEVHASNPGARGVRSTLLPVCKGAVCGFGYDGYRLALTGLIAGRSADAGKPRD